MLCAQHALDPVEDRRPLLQIVDGGHLEPVSPANTSRFVSAHLISASVTSGSMTRYLPNAVSAALEFRECVDTSVNQGAIESMQEPGIVECFLTHYA